MSVCSVYDIIQNCISGISMFRENPDISTLQIYIRDRVHVSTSIILEAKISEVNRFHLDIYSRVFHFTQKKHKWHISNTIEAYIVNLDVSFLGKKRFPSKLMGRGRASALKNYALTYKCQKNNFFKYSRYTSKEAPGTTDERAKLRFRNFQYFAILVRRPARGRGMSDQFFLAAWVTS